ncbi:MAG: TetR/AcrR family transcriptional regulator [Chloroflexota bacterium]
MLAETNVNCAEIKLALRGTRESDQELNTQSTKNYFGVVDDATKSAEIQCTNTQYQHNEGQSDILDETNSLSSALSVEEPTPQRRIGKKSTQTEHPRQIILDAAYNLIIEEGYAGLSMRELSRRSGVAKSTLYHYFQDKKSIYFSVIKRDMEIVQQEIVGAVAQGDTIETCLRSVINTYFALLNQRFPLFLMLLSGRSMASEMPATASPMQSGCVTLEQQPEQQDDIRKLLIEHRQTTMQPIIDLLQSGIATGELAPFDPQLTASSLFGMMNDFVANQVILHNFTLDDAVVEHVLALFLNGIQRR